MRAVVVSMIVSVDGMQEGPGGDVEALPFDDGFSRHNVERLRAASTMLLGRAGFEGFVSYWPAVQDDESQPGLEREISRLNTAMEKVVVSDSLRIEPESPWATTTRVVPRADAVAEVDALRRGEGGDVIVFGSATTWNPLIAAGLVDELHVLVGPALLGGGTPLYRGPRAPLALLEARRLPDSQLVLLRYDATQGASGA